MKPAIGVAMKHVPIEGLTWAKLLAGLGGFAALLVAVVTLHSMVVVPLIIAEADGNARAIAKDAIAAHAHVLHEGSTPLREFETHETQVQRQFDAMRNDIAVIRADTQKILIQLSAMNGK